MPRSHWRLEDGVWTLRIKTPLTEREFEALAADLARRREAEGRGVRSTASLPEIVLRRSPKVLRELRAALEVNDARAALKACRLGRLAQTALREERI